MPSVEDLKPYIDASVAFASQMRGRLEDPSVRERIPDLRKALELHRRDDDYSLLDSRDLDFLFGAHVPVGLLTSIYSTLVSCEQPFAILRHGPVISVAEKMELLLSYSEEIQSQTGTKRDESPSPVKTVTLRVREGEDYRFMLITGLGDFRVEKPVKRAIGDKLGISKKAMENSTINPSDFDTMRELFLPPGIVGPFYLDAVKAVDSVYLQDETPQSSLVELAVTPIESLILEKRMFEAALVNWKRVQGEPLIVHHVEEQIAA